MKNSFSESYKAAGVDVTAGYEGVRLMKKDVERTNIPGVLTGIGGFGGLFQLDIADMKEPVLVSGTDGVGTKLKLAMLMDKHDTIGIDAVAMCVNDIICCGAKPLYFLDYIAIGKNVPEKVAAIVKGVADGCVQSGCALIGGETAEHPGMMPEDEYDIAGYSTGVVDKSKIIDNSTVKEGDIIIGLASTGVHSNGFSLVRKVFNINSKEVLDEVLPHRKNSRRNAPYTYKDICKAHFGAYLKEERKGYLAYYRRRLQRERSPFTPRRLYSKDYKAQLRSALYLQALTGSRKHLRTRYVQYFQYGYRYDRCS